MTSVQRVRFGCGLALALLLAVGLGPNPPSPAFAAQVSVTSIADAWKTADQLVSEQKFEQASTAIAAIRESARAANDHENWTRALVREVQLRTGLHGAETALRFLREQPWPQDASSTLVLRLFYAHALTNYARLYSHEIRTRTRVEAKGPVDLKAWTIDQIYAEANATYAEAWQQREALDGQSRSALSRYLIGGGYPDTVRGTLRDLATYLWVEHLADTSGWTAAQNNERHRIPVAGLLAGGEAIGVRVSAIGTADGTLHPAQRLAALLHELHDWHSARSRSTQDQDQVLAARSAALEARLELARRLSQIFTDSSDRQSIISDLDRRLNSARDIAWFAQGKSVQAELLRALNRPVEAHAVARIGRDAYPNDIGGKRCAALMTQIEGPDFSLNAMAADSPGKRSIRVSHRNLDRLHFRAYAIDLKARLVSHQAPLPDRRTVLDMVGKDGGHRRGMIAQWSVALPATPDFSNHATYVTPPLSQFGLVLIVASANESFSVSGSNRIIGMPMMITNTVLTTRMQSGRYEVQTFDADSGMPVSGVDVELYEYSPRQRNFGLRWPMVSARTDDNGMAVLAQPRDQRGYFIAARRGGVWALDADYINAYHYGVAHASNAALIYTDRSVYRPEQKLLFKVLAYGSIAPQGRGAHDRTYALSTEREINVQLLDANGQEVERRRIRTNAFGTASGEFLLPAGRLLGRWSLRAGNGHASIRVEEYKRPTFEATLKEAAEPYRLNQAARVQGEARYYFGLPVTTGAVTWTVKRTPVYPMWFYWGARNRNQQEQTVAGGTASLNADGVFAFDFTPTADARLSRSVGLSYRYRVDVTITDDGGETRTASRGFRLGFVAVEAQLDGAAGYVRAGAEPKIIATRTDLDGTPRSGRGTWQLHALQMPGETLTPAESRSPRSDETSTRPLFRTPGDDQLPRWTALPNHERTLRQWPLGTERTRGSVTHDAKGKASIGLPALTPGAYRLRYQTLDRFGAEFSTQRDFLVADAGHMVPLAAALIPDKMSAVVGDTLRVLLASGLKNQTLYVDLWRNQQRTSRYHLVANPSATGTSPGLGQQQVPIVFRGTHILEIPILESMRGGFGLSLTAVRDHQVMQITRNVMVPWDSKDLEVEFSSFRDKLRPAAKEVWRVSVKADTKSGKSAEAVSAELLAYMYDRSLDLFAPHRPPSLRSVWPRYAAAPAASTSVDARAAFTAYNDWPRLPGIPALRPDRLHFLGGYAIGGMGRGVGTAGVRSRMMSDEMAPRRQALPASAPAVAARESSGKSNIAEEKVAVNREDDLNNKSAAPVEAGVRSNFSETAFFQPHLLTDKDGTATIEFTVPDSVTAWSVWVHAVSRDMRSGSARREARTVKDLLVRPYLPRFLREGDEAVLAVQVNNASDKPLSGEVNLEFTDPVSGTNANALFLSAGPSDVGRGFHDVPAGGSSTVTYRLKAPSRVHSYAVKVVATSGVHADGELRALPVLPSRVRLAQSRFVTLRNADTKTLRFADLATADPTRINDAMIVTVDAQLFGSVLSAVPYLQNYPYECTEQTMNRFVSSGILASVFKDNPAIAKMAAAMAARPTRLEALPRDDPNRKLGFEESPWLAQSQGKDYTGQNDADLVRVLDPKIAKAERDASLAKLHHMQLASGAFPWFAGGPESPYITLYLMAGLARAAEFNVPVPKQMVQRGWAYLATHFRAEYASKLMDRNCCWEWLTYLNYVASSYPDASWVNDAISATERARILDFSFKHWKRHSPLQKGMLTLTLKRAGRDADAALVWASVMDSAKSNAEQGTYWAPEDRSWLWYNDTIESHAFALRVLSELDPQHPKRDGLIHWLLLNKKLSHWKSTRATAEAIYALVHAMKQDKTLGVRELIAVTVNQNKTEFAFEPDRYTGRNNQIVVPGAQVDAATSAIKIEKSTPGFAFASATWHFSTEQLPAEERGDFFQVSRKYFRRDTVGTDVKLVPLAEGAAIKVGDAIEVQLSLRTKHAAEYVHLRDPRGAGFEPESLQSRWRYDLGLAYYNEVRDSGANFFFERLPVGEYTFRYRVRANMAGSFRVGPATVQSMYAPEFTAYSTGARLAVAAR